jgi:hypothetical protein
MQFVCKLYRKGTAWWTTSNAVRRSLTDDSGNPSFWCHDRGGCARRGQHEKWNFSGEQAQVYPEKLSDHVSYA